MPFGFGNNTAGNRTGGFRSSLANQGWNPYEGAKSFLLDKVNAEIPYTKVFSGFVSAGQRISNFDFNKTDEQLKEELKNYNIVLASSLGALAGRSIGKGLAIGGAGLAGITVPKISSTALAKRLVEASTENAKEEILEEVQNVFNVTKSLIGNRILIEGYMKFRSFLKKQPIFVLERFFEPEIADYIKNKWGAEGSEPLILSETIEEKIESISNPMIRAFVEEGTEEFFDSFIESGFIIAQELDTAFAEFQLKSSQAEQTIEIQTIADEPNSEKLIVSGTEQDNLIDTAQVALNNWRILQSRDVGHIVTRSVEVIRNNPQGRRLEITYRSKPFPPFVNEDGSPALEATLSIPNVKRFLSFDQIKRTLKYNPQVASHIYGNSSITLKFTKNRKLWLKFNSLNTSKETMQRYVEEIAELTQEVTYKISCSDVLEQPARNKVETLGLYPVEARLIRRNDLLLEGRNANSVPQSSYPFSLWLDNPPFDFQEEFNTIDV